MSKSSGRQARCRDAQGETAHSYAALPKLVDALVGSARRTALLSHVGPEPIPSRAACIALIERARRMLFPGYFTQGRLDAATLPYTLGQEAADFFTLLVEQITLAIRHDCLRFRRPCADCQSTGLREALTFMAGLPLLQRTLETDVRAAYQGDPAAKSFDEIIFSYPGLFAVMVHRIAHQLHRQGVALLPRIMAEVAHGQTGIDIHPGARIGDRFFIDHGTGVVVGETAVIGTRVRIYQGVTLGALSLRADKVEALRSQKRHPTIEDDVIIYAGATILGGDTVIGARSVIGGNVWLTESVPPDTEVFIKKPELVLRVREKAAAAPARAARRR